jgi:hypothetical protein
MEKFSGSISSRKDCPAKKKKIAQRDHTQFVKKQECKGFQFHKHTWPEQILRSQSNE